jgi:hypothetical protein
MDMCQDRWYQKVICWIYFPGSGKSEEGSFLGDVLAIGRVMGDGWDWGEGGGSSKVFD